MSASEILEKAIQKAIDNGWLFPYSEDFVPLSIAESYPSYALNNGLEYEDYDEVPVECIIFNHDFAKALWGEDGPTATRDGEAVRLSWNNGYKYHLQQMVIADDPIQYLGDNT